MKNCLVLLVLLSTLLSGSGAAKAQNVTKILDHGADGRKLTFVVMGDGYTAMEQDKFSQDVDNLVIKGVFGHDFYKDNIDAFNVYRVDLISKQSGVSTRQFSKDTSLKVIYSGKWERCWLEESQNTDQLITQAATKIAKYDYILVIANEKGYGGCRRGSRLYITSGDAFDVVAHEYGHAIAGLYDEYSVQGAGAYSATPINVKNCSVVLDRNSVVWSPLIGSTIDLPTDKSMNIDSNKTVGEFTGCNYAETKIFRPVKECRMNSTDRLFCPVCAGLMKNAVEPFLAPMSAPPASGLGPSPQSESSSTYLNLVIKISKHEKIAVLRATELAGNPIASQQASPAYFFAFTKNNEPSYADLLPEDPYLVRGFVDPKHPEKGENRSSADSATIIVNVPKTDMASASQNLGFQLYSLAPGTSVGTPSSDSKDLIEALLKKQGVKLEMSVSPEALGVAVSSKAKKADQF